MRLRSLRKLEEMEIKTEHKDLKKEQKELRALLKSDEAQWAKIAEQLRDVRKVFDPKSDLGRRRTEIADAPDVEDIDLDILVEKEPVSVVISEKGWVRTMKGHVEDKKTIKYKDGDRKGLWFTRKPPTNLCSSPPMGNFIPLMLRNCRAGAAMGSRSA